MADAAAAAAASNDGLPLPLPLPTSEDIGLIIPPPLVRNIIERTATLTAKHGAPFEQRILANPENSHKFAFLNPSSPYHVFYRRKVVECKSGVKDESLENKIPEGILQRREREKKLDENAKQLKQITALASESLLGSATSQSAREALEAGNSLKSITQAGEEDEEANLQPPAATQYSIQPPYATPQDIDIVKLTAQFAARSGVKFSSALVARERGNPQFAFLKPSHAMFPFYSSLVEIYSRCLTPDPACLETLRRSIGILDEDRKQTGEDILRAKPRLGFCDESPSAAPISEVAKMEHRARVYELLPRIVNRARWDLKKEMTEELENRLIAEEKQALKEIDWNSFVLVGTINLANENDNATAEAPQTLEEYLAPPPLIPLEAVADSAGAAAVEESSSSAAAATLPAATLPPGPSAPVERSEKRQPYIGPALPEAAQAGGLVAAPPAPLPPPPTTATLPAAAPRETEKVQVPAAFAGGNERVAVVKDYKREPKRRRFDSEENVKCPITGRSVPVHKLAEHLKIIFMDPQWKKQKDVLMAEAQKESAVVFGDDLTKNLSDFVINRPDLFGTLEDEVGGSFEK